jgi:hypothetical protein
MATNPILAIRALAVAIAESRAIFITVGFILVVHNILISDYLFAAAIAVITGLYAPDIGKKQKKG